jgi:hypothetical protein
MSRCRAALATVGMILGASSVSAAAQEQRAPLPTWELSTIETPASYQSRPIGVPDSVRVQMGHQHWRGAGLGAALAAAVGALTGALVEGNASCDDCRSQHSAGHGALVGGLVGAGFGGAAGFLVGLSYPKYVWVPAER